MRSQVQLYIRVRLPNGPYPYLLAAYAKNGRLKPGFGMHQGRAVEFSPCTYYLRYRHGGKRRWEAVGTDASTALVLLGRRTAELGEADVDQLGASGSASTTQAYTADNPVGSAQPGTAAPAMKWPLTDVNIPRAVTPLLELGIKQATRTLP